MSRPHPAHGSLMSLVAAVALLTAGCSATADGTEAAGCRETDGWSLREQARWLRSTVSFPGATAGEGADESAADKDAAVVIRSRGTNDGGPLCEPIRVQVEFWELTATTTGTDMTSVLRYRLVTDGSEDRAIGFPPGLSAAERDACTGVLMAAYPGARLTEAELPEDIGHLTSPTTADVEFGTDRIGAYRLFPPSDPRQCDADRRPTTTPAATSAPWPRDHR
ncbi:hypothetical protein [Streptomyces sp. NBC_01235]|uniref:hypothetical protein n=1 Tax=Streptomyces sp. NBC_01235 TaxID=2903788 RepID=UPI002E0E0D2B|nr:hypothetical protein OG289_34715 [Streptomyces sp. NBC_01235]